MVTRASAQEADRPPKNVLFIAVDDRITEVTKYGLGSGMSWRKDPGPDAAQTDGQGAAAAIRLLEENQERPFFLFGVWEDWRMG